MTQRQAPYRHVVLFKFRPGTSEDAVHALERDFCELARSLPQVKGFEWGRNSSSEGLDQGFTHCFVVTFDGPEGRDAYLPHPLHQAFVRSHVDPNVEAACVVDFLAAAER